MTKINNKWIIAIVILLVILMMQEPKKMAGELVVRNLPSSVAPEQQTTITLTATGTSGDYFAIVREDIPEGWTYVSGGAQEGNQVKGIISSLTGGSMTYILQAPSSTGTATFSGTYQFTDDPSPLTTGGDTQLSISEATYSCTGTIPQNANLCIGDDEGLTQDVPITLVDSCGAPKCEFVCYSSYHKEGNICVEDEPTCTPDWSCTDWSPAVCPASCEQTRTCTDANSCGVDTGKPAETQACSGGSCGEVTCDCEGWNMKECGTGANEGKRRFTRICTPSACDIEEQYVTDSTCAVTDACEFYQDLKDDGTCGLAGWVYLVIIFMAFILFMKTMG